jgi:hypothetical protein
LVSNKRGGERAAEASKGCNSLKRKRQLQVRAMVGIAGSDAGSQVLPCDR